MSGTPRRFARLARLGRRLADVVPLTPLGALVVAGAAVALRLYGYAQLDLVMLVVGWAGLGLPALSLVVVVLTALLLRLRAGALGRDVGGTRTVETRRETDTGFVLPSLWWMPLVQLSWSWEEPEGVVVTPRRSLLRAREQVWLEDRGELRAVVRRIVVSDVLGLARVAVRPRGALALDVLPSCGRLKRMPTLLTLAGGDELPHPMGVEDGDRVELRRYQPGDPARLVHWKVYARTRKLMVRWPERALVRSRRTVAYLVTGEDDDAAAGAARVAIETDALGVEWVFGADGGPAAGAKRRDEALALVTKSVVERARGGVGLGAFLSRAEKEGPASVVLFVPPVDGPWLPRVLLELRARRRVRVVVAIDAVARRRAPRTWASRLVTREPPPAPGVDAAALDRVLRALTTARAEVVVLDRATGLVLGEAHRARLDGAEKKAA